MPPRIALAILAEQNAGFALFHCIGNYMKNLAVMRNKKGRCIEDGDLKAGAAEKRKGEKR